MRNFTLTAAPHGGAQDAGGSNRLTRGWTTLFGLAFVFLMLSPLSSYAQHPYGFLDENVRSDDGLLDWEDIWIAQQSGDYSLLPAGSVTTDILFDAAAPDTIYFGGNTKDHLPISGWDWQSSSGSSSDKTNILESGAILIDGKIYFFGNKFASEGTTTIGFWFFQDDVSIDPSGGFNGEHTIGDILIVADIEQGGAVGSIKAYRYVGEGNGTLPSSNKAFVEISTTDGTLAGVVNTLEQATPWPHQSKNYPPNMLPPITFFEGFIDIASLGLTNACFSSFLMETRSSNPINSALEDFNLGGFNVTPAVSLADLLLCEDGLPATLTAMGDGGIGTLTFEWTKDGQPLAETSASIEIDELEDAGSYSVRAIGGGIGGVGECPSEPATAMVTINPLVDVNAGGDQSVCSDNSDVTLSGSISGGASSGSWSGGSGTFDPNASTLNAVYTPSAAEIAAGTVTLTLTSLDPEGPCEADSDDMIITIIGTPVLDPIGAVTACDSYELPAVGTISGDNLVSPQYYSDSQANNGVVITDLVLTASQTVWVYDESGTDPNCFDELSFVVTINDTPELDSIGDATGCDEYTLPDPSTISGSNLVGPQYYDDSQANDGELITEYTLTSSQTIWVYDETGTDPNCSDELSFDVVITDSPVADELDNVTFCDEYILPELSAGNQYFTGTGGTGDELLAGDAINSTQVIYIYAGASEPCVADQNMFTVTINDTPELNPIGGVSECDEYTLPDPSTLSGANLVDPQYYDDSQANGGELITEYTLTSSQTIWVYDETGTEPNCHDEISFDVVITDSPVADDLDNDTACDEYILPELSAGNQYFTGTGGTGDELFAGDAITSTQDIYIYAEASAPCIADENMFTITIVESPVADDLDNATACDEYILPELSAGNQYFTGAGASGTELFAGASITMTQNIYIYAEATAPCVADENVFMVTINDTPVLDPIAVVTECDTYTLPAPGDLTGQNLVNPQYYDDSQANGGQLITDLTLTMSQMVWVFDETGTDPNCSDEISFMVNIEECAKEGCTLGYWKNHTNRWCSDYGTATLYSSIFTAAPSKYSSLTLLQALNLKGGGVNNLIRQSTAALLNTCSGEVEYAYSDIQALINDVNAAFGGDAGAFATYLDDLNNAGCPLGGTEAYAGPWPLPAEPAASIVVDDAAAVAGDISVYPVPFKDELNLEYRFDYKSDVVIQVFDLRGQLVRSYKDTAVSKGSRSNFKVDFTVMPGQVYVLKVITSRENIIKKVSSSN